MKNTLTNPFMIKLNSIVRVLDILSLKFQNNVAIIKFRAQLPYLKNVRNLPKHDIIVNCIICGELTYDLVNYYELNDYLLIEGHLSVSTINLTNKPCYDLNITRLYPFLFTFEIS